MFDINMYNLYDLPNKVTYCNWRIGMVFNNGTENYKVSHNHNIIVFPINHQNSQSPRVSGRPLNIHPVVLYAIVRYGICYGVVGLYCMVLYVMVYDICYVVEGLYCMVYAMVVISNLFINAEHYNIFLNSFPHTHIYFTR